MPIERVVEYKISLPKSAMLELIFRLGSLGVFMPLKRPSKLPAPPIDPEVYDNSRKLIEYSRGLSKYVNVGQGQATKLTLEVSSLKDLLSSMVKRGGEVFDRVSQLENSIRGIRGELDRLRLTLRLLELGNIASLKNIRYVVVNVPARVRGDFEKALAQLSDAAYAVVEEGRDSASIIIMYPPWRGDQVQDVLRIYDLKPLDLPLNMDKASIEARVRQLEESLKGLEGEVYSIVERNRDLVLSIIELSKIVDDVIQTYVNSTIDEGVEMANKYESLMGQINALEARLNILKTLRDVYGELLRQGIRNMALRHVNYTAYVVRGYSSVFERAPGYAIKLSNGTVIYLAFGDLGEVKDAVKIPNEHLQDIEAALNIVNRELAMVEGKLSELKAEVEEFTRQHDEACNYTISESRGISDVATIRGFVLERNVERFERFLYETLTALAVDARVRRNSKIIQLSEFNVHEAPTYEDYPALVKAFRKIAYMYGIPGYSELSPVPLTAILFPIFFGWMFPDLGHGAILLVVGLLMNRLRYRGSNPVFKAMFSENSADWGLIFAMAGAWAIVFSILQSGEVFGVDLFKPILPWGRVFYEGSISDQWIMWAFPMAMLFGFTLLVLSLVLKAVNRARLGYRADALVSAWFPVTFVGFGLMIMNWGLVPVASLNPHFSILASKPMLIIGEALFIMGFVGSLSSLTYLKYFEGAEVNASELAIALALEAILDAFANTVSFLRLSIIALVHSIFTHMTYILSASLGLTTPIGILALALLNILIIAGEGFLTFIQSSRLTFYEMYSKFYEGVGTPYEPFKYSSILEFKFI